MNEREKGPTSPKTHRYVLTPDTSDYANMWIVRFIEEYLM